MILRGYSDETVGKVMGENFFRLWTKFQNRDE